MSFEIVLHWQHFILIVGAISALYIMLNGYVLSNDRMGMEGILRFAGASICFLFFLALYFGLGYFGVFK